MLDPRSGVYLREEEELVITESCFIVRVETARRFDSPEIKWLFLDLEELLVLLDDLSV